METSYSLNTWDNIIDVTFFNITSLSLRQWCYIKKGLTSGPVAPIGHNYFYWYIIVWAFKYACDLLPHTNCKWLIVKMYLCICISDRVEQFNGTWDSGASVRVVGSWDKTAIRESAGHSSGRLLRHHLQRRRGPQLLLPPHRKRIFRTEVTNWETAVP